MRLDRAITVVGAHAEGEVGRVITGGVVAPAAASMFERMQNIERDMPWLDQQSQQARDIERFRWFSNGYIALDPEHVNRIIDVRYSMLPNAVDALWSVQVSPVATATQHADYLVHRDSSDDLPRQLWQMLTGD